MGFSDFLFGSEGTPSTVQTVTQPTFGFNEPAREASSNFLVEQLQSVGRGELPSFFQNQIPMLRRGLDRGLRQSFFGLPGRRGEGTVSQALSAGALTGLGPRAGIANVNKQLQNFTNQSQAIDEFIASQGVNVANQVAQNFPGVINAAPQGPPSQSFMVPGQAGTQGFLGPALGTALGAFIGGPGGAALGSKIFGGGGQPGFSGGNIPGSGIFGTKLGGQTQSEVLGFNTSQFRSSR
jgi:hypothetical protein